MSKNYLIGSFILEYAGREFHANLQGLATETTQRLAPHEFVKVDGAFQEFMGGAADSYRVNLVFLGDSWRADYAAAVAHLKKNPKGLLVHPVHGQKRAAWRSISDSIDDIGRAVNAITATVVFAEDNLDPAAGQPQTVAAQAAKVSDYGAQLTTASAGFSVGTVAQVAGLVAAANAYANDAVDAAQGTIADPSLGLVLASVGTSTSATLAALAGDAVAASTLATARTLAIQVYAACLEVDAATASLQPVLEFVTLPGAVALGRLCADRYGSQAQAMRDLVLLLNRVPNPYLVPAGTVLRLPAVT